MKTICTLSQKGGSGKSTTSINLAVAFVELGYRVVIIDLDKQASAKIWYNHRQRLWHDKGLEESPYVIETTAVLLEDALAKAKAAGADLCIIDTAPHSESDAYTAAGASDLILIPCRAEYLDLKAVETSAKLAKLAGKPALFVLNAIPPGSKSRLADATAGLKNQPFKVAPVHISQRVAFSYAITAGQGVTEYEPDGAAARDIRELCLLTCNHVGMVPSKHAIREAVNA